MSYPYQQQPQYPGYPPAQGQGPQMPQGQGGALGFEGMNTGAGYPSAAPGYPPNSGYPQNTGYPSQQPGYPPSQPAGYPPAGGGYPPQQQPGYPAPGGGYPPQQQPPSGYPSAGGGYPQQQQQPPGYPSAGAGGYPGQQQQPGYPGATGYPQSNQPGGYPMGSQPPPAGGMGYPGQAQPPPQAGYPAMAQGHNPGFPSQQQPPAAAGYPQAGGYPTSQQHGAQSYPQQQPAGHGAYPSTQQPGGMGHQQPGGMGQQQPGYGSSAPPVASSGSQHSSSMASAQQSNTQGTLKPFPGFNATSDAEVCKKAMKGIGCDDKAIINVLCYRTATQRAEIRRLFKVMFGKDLIDMVKGELRGNLENLVVALLYSADEFDAHSLRNAMDGIGTNESILIEVMCTRKNAEIHAIRDTYKRLFKRDLEKDLMSETSGHFKRLLVSMVQGGRDESWNIDPARARQDADRLYRAGEKTMGTDEATFNSIIAAQNFGQLRLVFEQYAIISKKDIEKSIRSEFSGYIEDGLLAAVKCARNAPSYFAEQLHSSMKGMGTKDNNLIRVMVTRCEKDMVQIKQEFQRTYGKTLESFIAGDTSGNYKDALLKLAGGA